jgi:hypothetical protein
MAGLPLPILADGAAVVATWVALIIVFLSPVRIR